MSTVRNYRRAILLMIGAATLWSFAGIGTRQLDAAGGFEISFWRSLFAVFFLLAVLGYRHGAHQLSRSLFAGGRLGLMSGLMWASMFICYMVALTMTTVANVLIVSSLAPLLTAMLAWIFLRERIATRTWMAIVVACGGMMWMFAGSLGQGGGLSLSGLLIALVVPLTTATNYVLMHRAGHRVDMMPSVLIGALLATLLMLPLVWPVHTSLHDVVILALLGMFQLALPCLMVVAAARTLSSPAVSLLGLLEVLLGPFWAWIGASEVPAQATLSGGAVVLAALVLNEIAALKKPRVA